MTRSKKIDKKFHDLISEKNSTKVENRTYKKACSTNKRYLSALNKELQELVGGSITPKILYAVSENNKKPEYFRNEDKRRSEKLGITSYATEELCKGLLSNYVPKSLASRRWEFEVWETIGASLCALFSDKSKVYAVTIKPKKGISKKAYENEEPSAYRIEVQKIIKRARFGTAVLYRDEAFNYKKSKSNKKRLSIIPHYQGFVSGDIVSVLMQEKKNKNSDYKIWIKLLSETEKTDLAKGLRYSLKSVTYQVIGRSHFQPGEKGKKVPLKNQDEGFILKERSKRFLQDYLFFCHLQDQDAKAVTTNGKKITKRKKSKTEKSSKTDGFLPLSSKPDEKIGFISPIISEFQLSSSFSETCHNLSQMVTDKDFYELKGSFGGKLVRIARGEYKLQVGSITPVESVPILIKVKGQQDALGVIDLAKKIENEIDRLLKENGISVLNKYTLNQITKQIDNLTSKFEVNSLCRNGLNSYHCNDSTVFSYLFPDGQYVSSSDEMQGEQPLSIPKMQTNETVVEVNGDIDPYFEAIFPLIRDHHTGILLAGISLLPILQQIDGIAWNRKGFVFALFGDAGIGKTVLSELIGNSSWRSAESNYSWDSTENFLKDNASIFDGVPILVDDVSKGPKKISDQRSALNSLGMNVDMGIPKGRFGDSPGNEKDKFSTVVITSANYNFADRAFSNDQTERAKARRVMFVPAERVKRSKSEITQLYQTIAKHHGFLGPLVAKAICYAMAEDKERLEEYLNKRIKICDDNLQKKFGYQEDDIVEEQRSRFSAVFAVLSFARKVGLFPKEDTGSISDALTNCFANMLEAMGYALDGTGEIAKRTFGDKLLKSAKNQCISIIDVRNTELTALSDEDIKFKVFITHARDQNCDLLVVREKDMIKKLVHYEPLDLKQLKRQGELLTGSKGLQRQVRVRMKRKEDLSYMPDPSACFDWVKAYPLERGQDRFYCFPLSAKN